MGIDVEFQAVIPKILTEEEVSKLFEEMKYKFHAQAYIDSIEILKQEDLFLDVDFKIPDGHTLLDFKTLCRLYAEDYPRGNPIPWIIYSEFIEFRYKGAWVSYTGDCYHYIAPWTKADREALKLHYFE